MHKIIAVLFLVFFVQIVQGQVHANSGRTKDAVIVTGKVFNAKVLGSGMTLLNIGGNFPDHLFEVMILASDRSKFYYKPEEKLIGKYVQVTGSFTDSKGKLLMTISDPAQLSEVMDPKAIISQQDLIKLTRVSF